MTFCKAAIEWVVYYQKCLIIYIYIYIYFFFLAINSNSRVWNGFTEACLKGSSLWSLNVLIGNVNSFLLPFLFFVGFFEDFAVCALPYVQYAKGSSQASPGLSYGPQQLPSHPAIKCHLKRWSVPPLAWCLHLAQLGPNEDPWEPLQHWKRGLASQTGSLYGLLYCILL